MNKIALGTFTVNMTASAGLLIHYIEAAKTPKFLHQG